LVWERLTADSMRSLTRAAASSLGALGGFMARALNGRT
jgi:hypothetical protein